MPLNLQAYKRYAKPPVVGKPRRGSSAVPTVVSPVQPLMQKLVPGWKPPAGFTVPKATGFQSAGAAAAGPAAPAPPTNPMPWDTQYESEVNTSRTGYTGTVDAIRNAAGRTGTDYGYKVGFTPLNPKNLPGDDLGSLDGSDPLALSDEDVDAIGRFNNPFSKLALIRKAYGERQNYTRNSLAAIGQKNSGYYQTKKRKDQDNNTQTEHFNRLGFEDAIRGLAEQRGSAFHQLLGNVDTAGGNRLDRAIAARPEEPGPAKQPLPEGVKAGASFGGKTFEGALGHAPVSSQGGVATRDSKGRYYQHAVYFQDGRLEIWNKYVGGPWVRKGSHNNAWRA